MSKRRLKYGDSPRQGLGAMPFAISWIGRSADLRANHSHYKAWMALDDAREPGRGNPAEAGRDLKPRSRSGELMPWALGAEPRSSASVSSAEPLAVLGTWLAHFGPG